MAVQREARACKHNFAASVRVIMPELRPPQRIEGRHGKPFFLGDPGFTRGLCS
jgi:hypothetical protein